jgi:hypothetical protein
MQKDYLIKLNTSGVSFFLACFAGTSPCYSLVRSCTIGHTMVGIGRRWKTMVNQTNGNNGCRLSTTFWLSPSLFSNDMMKMHGGGAESQCRRTPPWLLLMLGVNDLVVSNWE